MTATLAAWLHDLDPFLLRISGDFGLRWYGLAYIAGFGIAYFLMRTLARRKRILIPADRLADAMLWLIGGTIVGGRLAYVLIYDRSLITDFSSRFPFWGALAINKGGMASHGGILGLALAAWRISRGWRTPDSRTVGRVPLLHVFDVCVLTGTPGLLFGRLANFINGELLGAVVSPPGREGPWWTVQFPQELTEGGNKAVPLDATQTAQLSALVVEAAPGKPYAIGLDRLVERAGEFADRLKPLLSSRHPSQLYQAAAEGFVLSTILWLIWARPRKPGVIGAWFLIVYGVLRVLTEVWRLPDSQFADGRPFGLSRGQWLSVVMVACGAAMLWRAVRRPGPKLGGWWTPSNEPFAQAKE
jgi:phosphatidylglycerol:prolipoprotein diacylglycerol transferase